MSTSLPSRGDRKKRPHRALSTGMHERKKALALINIRGIVKNLAGKLGLSRRTKPACLSSTHTHDCGRLEKKGASHGKGGIRKNKKEKKGGEEKKGCQVLPHDPCYSCRREGKPFSRESRKGGGGPTGKVEFIDRWRQR